MGMKTVGIKSLPCVVAGQLIEPRDEAHAPAPKVSSLDGTIHLPVAETSPTSLRSALRFAAAAQARLEAKPLAERVAVAKQLLAAFAARREEIAWGLGLFRGQVARDSFWMADVVQQWGEELDDFLSAMQGGSNHRLVYPVGSRFEQYGEVRWRSRGQAAMFCAATMDGPAAVTALCHGIISGTHMIVRPSWRDTVTHLAFEILLANGHTDYAQLVRWRSDAPEAPLLNRQILAQSTQSLIFSSNETFQALIKDAATPGTDEWEEIFHKSRRYGTGLPLNIVTPNCDLKRAARDLVEGARLGGGRFCLSTTPVMVMQSCYDELTDLIVKEARRLQPGSLLEQRTDLARCDPSEAQGLTTALQSFGGQFAHGSVTPERMDLIVLRDVPLTSACLHRELSVTALALMPVASFAEAAQAAKAALRKNHREAWTALCVHGDVEDFQQLSATIDSYRYLSGGVVAEGKLLLPHQGTYFTLDLMRRVTSEVHVRLSNLKTA